MIDTLNFFITKSDTGISDNFKIAEYLSNHSEFSNINGTYVNGFLGDNYKVGISKNGISFKGSLAKYYYGDNFQTLTFTDTKQAIEKMSDELLIPIVKGKLSRIDFAQNFVMDVKPELYFNHLGECQHYSRFNQPSSLYYQNSTRKLNFYNKYKELKQPKFKFLQVENIDKNLLRYEMSLFKRIPKIMGVNDMSVGKLKNEKTFITLFDKWQRDYKSIKKQNEANMNYNEINSPNDFIKQLAFMKLNEIGINKANELIEELKAKDVFKHKSNYSQLKKQVYELCNSPKFSEKSDLVLELDSKVLEADNFLR